jgi:hypothetical protein
MRTTASFLFGFMAVAAPVSMYAAWIIWRIAEAI